MAWPERTPSARNSGSARPASPRDAVYRDIGVSRATGTDLRHGWHRLDGRLSGGDILVVVRIDRIGRRWLDTLQCIISLRARGVKIRSLDETGGMDAVPRA